jgi:hypothetical protein
MGAGTASLVGVPDSRVYLIYGQEEFRPSERRDERSEIRVTVVLMGLVFRQQRGPESIGFESLSILVLYLAGFLVLALTT